MYIDARLNDCDVSVFCRWTASSSLLESFSDAQRPIGAFGWLPLSILQT